MKLSRFTAGAVTLAIAALLSILPAAVAQTPPSGSSAAATTQSTAAQPGGLLDINSASASQLKSLPGIGDVYAQKIIAGRPYANKSQLKSRGIVPAGVYSKISGMIIAKQPAK